LTRICPHGLAAVSVALLLSAGCDKSGKDKLVAVSGTVTLDGQPMKDGEISFSTPGEPPQVLPIKDGAFQGEVKGGKRRVEIRAYKEGVASGGMYKNGEMAAPKQNYIPDKYNNSSQLTADVTPGGQNQFKFEITSR